ncbi:unnamed protein product (mitochondrion) [Plasmodiophora brassicae]|uniref:Sfi1 spindle body domain-containing protein n=2 Tax=Plasmodiophora brassicae TaxID=37360 RepID=A0A3P3Y7H6_PLABS|nr:unnamed protein product [Plasmodiophora brassicae]
MAVECDDPQWPRLVTQCDQTLCSDIVALCRWRSAMLRTYFAEWRRRTRLRLFVAFRHWCRLTKLLRSRRQRFRRRVLRAWRRSAVVSVRVRICAPICESFLHQRALAQGLRRWVTCTLRAQVTERHASRTKRNALRAWRAVLIAQVLSPGMLLRRQFRRWRDVAEFRSQHLWQLSVRVDRRLLSNSWAMFRHAFKHSRAVLSAEAQVDAQRVRTCLQHAFGHWVSSFEARLAEPLRRFVVQRTTFRQWLTFVVQRKSEATMAYFLRRSRARSVSRKAFCWWCQLAVCNRLVKRSRSRRRCALFASWRYTVLQRRRLWHLEQLCLRNHLQYRRRPLLEYSFNLWSIMLQLRSRLRFRVAECIRQGFRMWRLVFQRHRAARLFRLVRIVDLWIKAYSLRTQERASVELADLFRLRCVGRRSIRKWHACLVGSPDSVQVDAADQCWIRHACRRAIQALQSSVERRQRRASSYSRWRILHRLWDKWRYETANAVVAEPPRYDRDECRETCRQ